jgi:hypothetical protein
VLAGVKATAKEGLRWGPSGGKAREERPPAEPSADVLAMRRQPMAAPLSSALDPTNHVQPSRSSLPPQWFAAVDAAAPDNEVLREMFRLDQLDRGIGQPASWLGIDWNDVGPRDDARRRRVREILNASAVRSALDFYHAAFMMHHSAYCEEYELANVLSLVAVEIEPHNADYRWLFAAAKDRMLVAKGLPQLFGVHVQIRRKRSERWFKTGLALPTRSTDLLRAQWGLKPLSTRPGTRRIEREPAVASGRSSNAKLVRPRSSAAGATPPWR